MKTTIDSAGRVVIPKSVRDQAHITPGREVEVRFQDGAILIEPVPLSVKLRSRGGLLVAEPQEEVSPLSEEIVERTRDELASRRGRR